MTVLKPLHTGAKNTRVRLDGRKLYLIQHYYVMTTFIEIPRIV